MSRTATRNTTHQEFLKTVGAAERRLLLVDYDGTIAPFCSDRDRAIPYPEIAGLLQAIAASCNTRLIIVTGRAAAEVVPLLGGVSISEIWGAYGLETLYPDGRLSQQTVADDALQVLEQAEIMLEGRGLGGAMEVKLAGVAVHWRGLPAREVLDIRTKAYRILEPFLAASDLLLADFDEGVELRLRSANKGEAVQRMLRQLPDNVPTAYLGDDTSDEEAFRVLNGRGLTVLVRSKPRFTAAQLWLRPPDELAVFLRNWIRASRGDA